ncbi:MAG: HD-GYP domain-containing protein, partial [Synergistaceae bacterium]|nr:HD-GYP domain-containing protein [Synergistaceae bacterium]
RVLSVVRNHHDRWGGHGYPDSLQKNSIPLFARIVAVADVFDALTAKRVYKNPLSSREAVSMILESSENDFDKGVVRELLLSVGLYPAGTLVELSDFSVGVVVGARNTDLFRPQVSVTIDGKGRRAPEGTIVDLGLQQDLFVRRALDDVGKGVAYSEKAG